MTQPRTIPLRAQDLPGVARIHVAAFKDSALSRLGFEAVRRYYEWQLTGPHDVAALGVYLEEQLVAFSFGGIFRSSLGGFVEKNRAFLVRLVVSKPWLLANPVFRDRLRTGLRVLRAFRRYRSPRLSAIGTEPPMRIHRSFGILAIAVDPQIQGTGAGRSLMIASERIARERGFEAMNLTVHPENVQAVGFYEHLGWRRVAGADGCWHGAMAKSLHEDE